MVTILTYGGGINSAALVLLMIAHKEPPPHAILFADTRAEKPHTYNHLKIVSDFIQNYGYPEITVLQRSAKNFESLEQQCLRLGVMPSVAYGWKTCSQKYKLEPQNKWCNNDPQCRAVWSQGGKVIKIIGYDYGEIKRARFGEDEKYILRYPLIDWKIDRSVCEYIIQKVGLPLPGKSACFFCPHSKKKEIIDLATRYPDLAQRALTIEERAKAKTRKAKGLGRSFAWRDILADHNFPVQEDPYDEEPCGCYDG